MEEKEERDWRELCAAMVKEQDSFRLAALAEQLLELLNAETRRTRETQ
jgi:hypothetical protein